ncbi:MAG: hypothetical protein AAF732_09180 [Pseudomonadota bacterium]
MLGKLLPRSIRLWLMFLIIVGISHIVTTFWLASGSSTTDFRALVTGLPSNRFSLLETLTPETQRLPFMIPESHYAVCPFDTSNGRVLLDVRLEDVGWILSLHAPDGTVIYYAPGAADRETNLRLVLKPPGGRFLGLPVGGVGPGPEIPEVQLENPKGVAILRVPLYGLSYAALAVNALKQSSCREVQSPRLRTADRPAG